jgi:DamX protein
VPSAQPVPPAPKAKAVVETTPRPTRAPTAPISETVARPAPAPAPAAGPAAGAADDRMPTQAKPPTALNAAPGAEAMPTQGPPRSGGRGRE